MGTSRVRHRNHEHSSSLSPATIRFLAGLALAVVASFLVLAHLGLAGPAGAATTHLLQAIVGDASLIVPLAFLAVVWLVLRQRRGGEPTHPSLLQLGGAVLMLLGGVGLFAHFPTTSGGVVGEWIASPLEHFFGRLFTAILLVSSLAAGAALTFDGVGTDAATRGMRWIARITHRGQRLAARALALITAAARRGKRRRQHDRVDEEAAQTEAITPPPSSNPTIEADAASSSPSSDQEEVHHSPTPAPATAEPAPSSLSITQRVKEAVRARSRASDSAESREAAELSAALGKAQEGSYTPPPLSLLKPDAGGAAGGNTRARANIIQRTLHNFGITVEMAGIEVGPTVTRYAFKPAEGVRLSRIVALQRDLELALAASPIRIEAPIPNRPHVGIEVPNKQKARVGLRELLAADAFRSNPHPLVVALGRDISGEPHYANIARMPHLLVAGATGSGKSVMVHSIVASLLYRNGPDLLRFIFVDPKRVELTLYNGVPHLLTQVITDPKRAILALRWAIREMERRYEVLEGEQVRDIASYHRNVVLPAYRTRRTTSPPSEDLPEAMPYLLIVIDELADLMQAYPRELEGAIVRLAQMARAVGIHLILSTQRPSVDVLTGLIKANIPTRIALQVSSQIDSRTILDQPGAEKLLGAGDLLYLSSDRAKPIRLQGPFISEEEVKAVVRHLRTHGAALDVVGPMLDFEEEARNGATLVASLEEDSDDELYEEAKQVVLKLGKASTSLLQRKLRIGYSRAARIIDLLEERGIIGPADGAKPRPVLASAYASTEDTPEPGAEAPADASEPSSDHTPPEEHASPRAQ